MDRVVEPELMLADDQARAYAAADFSTPHQAAIERFAARFPDFGTGRVLDVACGPADVTVRFARAYPGCDLLGLDGSPAMLALARSRVVDAGLASRVEFAKHVIPSTGLTGLGPFDAVICTSALHHFHDPAALWETVRACSRPGTSVLVQDLMRPDSEEVAQAFVERYAADDPEVLRRDYLHSLRAAFTVDEVQDQLQVAALWSLTVEAVSDRHLLVTGTAP